MFESLDCSPILKYASIFSRNVDSVVENAVLLWTFFSVLVKYSRAFNLIIQGGQYFISILKPIFKQYAYSLE